MKKVITIIIFFSCLFSYPASASRVSSKKVYSAKTQIEMLSMAIQSLKQDIGRYPTEDEGLDLLIESSPQSRQKWDGPYLKKALPNDPWHHKYVYYYPARYGNQDFDLYSFGVNGQDDKGEKDDIANWRGINKEYDSNLSKYSTIQAFLISIIVFVILVISLVRFRSPSFSALPRRFALTNSLTMIFSVLLVIFTPTDADPNQFLGIFFAICFFGFSIVGTIVSLVAISKGLSKARSILFAIFNLLPILTVAALWIHTLIKYQPGWR